MSYMYRIRNKWYFKLVSSLFAFVFFLILFFEYIGVKNASFLNNVIKSSIEKRIPDVKIKQIDTHLYLDLKNFSVVLGVKNLTLLYQNFDIKTPNLKLLFSPKELVRRNLEHSLKKVMVLDGVFQILKSDKRYSLPYKETGIDYIYKIFKSPKYKKLLNLFSYSMDDFSFEFYSGLGDIHTIKLQNFKIEVGDLSKKFEAQITSQANYNNAKFDIKVGCKQSEDFLLIDGEVFKSQEDNNDVQIFSLNYSPAFKLRFSTKLLSLNFIENISFEFLQIGQGDLYHSRFLSEPLHVDKLAFRVAMLNNLNDIEASGLKGVVNKNIKVSGDYFSKNHRFNLNFQNLSTKNTIFLWNKEFLPDVREWLRKSVVGGYISELTLDKKDSLSSKVGIKIKNTAIKYKKNIPRLAFKDVLVSVSDDSVKIESASASLANVAIKKIGADIDLVREKGFSVDLVANLSTDISSQLKLAKLHGYNLNDVPNINGDADTKISFSIPLEKEVGVKNFSLNAILKSISISDVYKDYTFVADQAHLNIKDGEIKFHSDGKLNSVLDMSLFFTSYLAKGNGYQLNINANDSYHSFQKAKIPASEYFSDGQLLLRAFVERKGGKNVDVTCDIDLDNTSFSMPFLGINKEMSEKSQAKIRFYYDKKKQITIDEINVVAKDDSLKGAGYINESEAVVRFLNAKKNISLEYKKNDSDKKFILKAETIDFRDISMESVSAIFNGNNLDIGHGSNIKIMVKKLLLKKNLYLDIEKIELQNTAGGKLKLSLKGKMNGNDVLVYYNSPILVIRAENGGDLLRSLGVVDTINEGVLEIKGRIEDNIFKGDLFFHNFITTHNNSSLINLLAFSAPLSTIKNNIKKNGLRFKKLECVVVYQENQFFFNDCLAESELVAIKSSGSVGIDGNVKLTGVLIPEHMFNALFSKIPFLNLFSGKGNEGLILSTTFKGQGNVKDNVEIKANYLSTITPGFLREAFK